MKRIGVSRRDFIKYGAAGVAGSYLASGFLPQVALAYGGHGDGGYGGGGSGSSSPPTTPFTTPLPLPQVLAPSSTDATTDYYQITQRMAQVQIIPGLTTTIWGYNGLYPGPTIKARSGRRVVVRQTNDLPEGISTHLHGGHTPSSSDGLPTDIVAPGASRDYIYPNNQIACTLWYHDHAMDVTGPHVYKGLAGFYILQDDAELALNLPSGDYDIPLVIQDRQFNSDGSLFYPVISRSVIKDGFTGDKILVNGGVQPYFQVANRKYRFRILNGSNTRDYDLALNINGSYSGPSFVQIGTDGGLIQAPVTRSTIPLAPAERVEVVIDFSSFPVGTQIILKNNKGYGTTGDIMRFDVVRTETDPSSLPATLRPLATLPSATVTRNIDLEYDRNLDEWVLNGRPFDPAHIEFSPKLNATEIWRFNNHSGMMHPMHIHDIMFQVVSGGDRNAPAGWKDTVAVDSWGSASVKMQFTDYTGVYVSHCHKLEHEDFAMMMQFQVVP